VRVNADIARPASAFGGFSTSLFFSSAEVNTYSATPAFDSTGASIKINGQPAYYVTKNNANASIEPNLGGVFFYAWDEEDDPLFVLSRALLHYSLRGNMRSGFMVGVGVNAGGSTSTPIYKMGYSIFMDRNFTCALSVGVAFEQTQKLPPGLQVNQLVTTSAISTSSAWNSGLFFGLSFNLGASTK
jgi:hypothetical protein